MLNRVTLVGMVLRVQIPERYQNDPKYSPVLIIQFGDQRSPKRGASVHFINAVPVKVLAPKWQTLKDFIKEGDVVEIDAHLQGIIREEDDFRRPDIEIVAERVNLVNFKEVQVVDQFTKQQRAATLPLVTNLARKARELQNGGKRDGAEDDSAQ